MTTEWDEIKSAFSDGTNTGFQTDVVLRARKFDGEKIYECGFLPDDMVEYSLAGDRHYQRIGRRPRSRQSCHSNPWFKADDVNLLRAVTHLSSFLLCHTFTSSSLLHTHFLFSATHYSSLYSSDVCLCSVFETHPYSFLLVCSRLYSWCIHRVLLHTRRVQCRVQCTRPYSSSPFFTRHRLRNCRHPNPISHREY